MNEPRKETEPHPRTIGNLDHNVPLEGSHLIENEDQIPKDETVIFLNAGHAEKIPADLVQPSELYYKETHMSKENPKYTIYVAIKVDNLIHHPLFQSNISNTKDFVFKGIYQQLNQDPIAQKMSIVAHITKKIKENPNNQAAQQMFERQRNSLVSIVTRDYNQARATRRILTAAGSYETTKEYRNRADQTSAAILSRGPLENQLQNAKAEIENLTKK